MPMRGRGGRRGRVGVSSARPCCCPSPHLSGVGGGVRESHWSICGLQTGVVGCNMPAFHRCLPPTLPHTHMSKCFKRTDLWQVSQEAQDEMNIQVELTTRLLGGFQDAGEEGGEGDVAGQMCLLF